MAYRELKKRDSRLSAIELRRLLIILVVLVASLSLLTIGNYHLARILPGGGEFYLLRNAGQSFLYDHVNPYSAGVPAQVQEQVYGHPAISGEDPYILDIPFYVLPIFFPLAIFPDSLLARAFWLLLSEIGLIILLLISYRLTERSGKPLLLVLVTLISLPSFYVFTSLVEGSVSILLGCAFVGILLSLRAGIDELAGALLVLCAFQWEISGPFLLFVVISLVWAKRWRAFQAAAMLAIVLLVISFLLYPEWVIPFLRAVWNSLQVNYGFSTHLILTRYIPGIGNLLSRGLTLALIVLLGFEWNTSRNRNFLHFFWAACLTLSVAPLLGMRSEMDQLVVLLIPLVLIVVIAHERWKGVLGVLVNLILLVIVGIPWLIFVDVIPTPGLLSEDVLFLIMPVFTVIGLYWIRWWTIRPPQTWVDRMNIVKQ